MGKGGERGAYKLSSCSLIGTAEQCVCGSLSSMGLTRGQPSGADSVAGRQEVWM